MSSMEMLLLRSCYKHPLLSLSKIVNYPQKTNEFVYVVLCNNGIWFTFSLIKIGGYGGRDVILLVKYIVFNWSGWLFVDWGLSET